MRFDPYIDDLNKRFPRRREIPPSKPLLLYFLLAALILLVLVVCATTGHAQMTITPLQQECGLKCRGQFTVTNNALVPVVVVVDAEAFSLGVSPDHTAFAKDIRPLDSSVTVKLSDLSARLGPKASHTFSYNLTCANEPCMVGFYAGVIKGKTAQGIAVKVGSAVSVYMCTKQKGCRAQVFKAAGIQTAAK